jgi:hypothetical protein
MGVWTLMFVSTKGNRGHTHTFTPSWGARKKAPVADESGAASDCGRDASAGSLGGTTVRRYDVNANQVFHWRKLYREGRLGTTTNFLPVRVADEQRGEAVNGSGFIAQPGTMEIKLSRGTLRILGTVDVAALRTVIECLV